MRSDSNAEHGAAVHAWRFCATAAWTGVRRKYFGIFLVVLCLAGSAAWAGPADEWRAALARRDTNALERLLGSGVDPNLAAYDGTTALMIASRKGRTAFARALLAAGANANQANDRGGTALMYAAVAGALETLKLLLDGGATVNHQASNGWSALTIASAKGHEAAVELLVNQGADINVADIYGWTPLMRAVETGHLGVVRSLLAQPGIDLEARDDQGATALHHAAIGGNVEIIELLIKTGANPHCGNHRGLTPLMMATGAGHHDAAAVIQRALNGSVAPPE